MLSREQIEERLNLLTMAGEEPLEAQALETALTLYGERDRLLPVVEAAKDLMLEGSRFPVYRDDVSIEVLGAALSALGEGYDGTA